MLDVAAAICRLTR